MGIGGETVWRFVATRWNYKSQPIMEKTFHSATTAMDFYNIVPQSTTLDHRRVAVGYAAGHDADWHSRESGLYGLALWYQKVKGERGSKSHFPLGWGSRLVMDHIPHEAEHKKFEESLPPPPPPPVAETKGNGRKKVARKVRKGA